MLTVPDSMPAADKRSQASEALLAPDIDAGRGGQEKVPDSQVAEAQEYKVSVRVCAHAHVPACVLRLSP